MSVLKNCPFCGGKAKRSRIGPAGTPFTIAECFKCGVFIENGNPVEAWNTRAQTPLEQELVDALQDVVDAFAPNEKAYQDRLFSQRLKIDAARKAIAKAEGKSPNNQTDGVA